MASRVGSFAQDWQQVPCSCSEFAVGVARACHAGGDRQAIEGLAPSQSKRIHVFNTGQPAPVGIR